MLQYLEEISKLLQTQWIHLLAKFCYSTYFAVSYRSHLLIFVKLLHHYNDGFFPHFSSSIVHSLSICVAHTEWNDFSHFHCFCIRDLALHHLTIVIRWNAKSLQVTTLSCNSNIWMTLIQYFYCGCMLKYSLISTWTFDISKLKIHERETRVISIFGLVWICEWYWMHDGYPEYLNSLRLDFCQGIGFCFKTITQ